MIPPDRLPRVLRIVGWFLPPTYAARAFRASLAPGITGETLLDVAILAAFAIGLLILVGRTLEWRLEWCRALLPRLPFLTAGAVLCCAPLGPDADRH